MTDPTTSLDLPASLQALFQMENPAGGDMQVYRQQQRPVYGFAEGGMVGPTGAPVGQMPMQGQMSTQPMAAQVPQPGGLAMPNPNSGQMSQADVDAFVQQNPEAVQQIRAVIQEEVDAGELDMDELRIAVEMAELAIQNPDMYPQVRRAMLQQGVLDEGDLPADPQGGMFMMFLIVVAARSYGDMEQMPMGGMEQLQEAEMQNFADGGYVKPYDNAKDGGKVVGPGTGTSDSVPVKVSTGEYIIPAHIVQMKGKEFFDSMLNKYRK